MILAVVVRYKAAKKDHSVTRHDTTCYDINWTSHAQYMAMKMDKISTLVRFEEHQASISK